MPNKKEKIPATVRNSVWEIYNGPNSISKCFCCDVESISKANFVCGHILAENKNGTVDLENLVPLCSSCNLSMGTQHMFEFMKKYKMLGLKNFTENGVPIKYNDKNSFQSSTLKKIDEKYYSANYIRKMNNKPKIKINDINLRNVLDSFINKSNSENITRNQLAQICLSKDISPNGSFEKIILRLIKYTNSNNIVEYYNSIKDLVKNKKYFVVCEGDITERCNNCIFDKGIDFTIQCEHCRNQNYHTYYSNRVLIDSSLENNDKLVVYRECKCKKSNMFTIYKNAFSQL